MLKKKIARDGRVAQLTPHSALLYIMSIPHLDIDGRMDGNPVAVRGTVVPVLASAHPDQWTDGRVESCMIEWTGTRDEDSGRPRALVAHYLIGGVWVCYFAGFAENQILRRDRERPSSFPAPPPMLLERLGIQSDADSDDTPDADSGQPPDLPRTQAEAEAEVQTQTSRAAGSVAPAPARETLGAALQDQDLAGKAGDDLAARILEGVERRTEALESHGPLASLLAVLPDADENTPRVLHALFDPLGVDAIAIARREIESFGPRRPTAYAVRIGQRLARGDAR